MGVARRKLHVGRRLGNGPPDALAELDDGVDVPGPVDIPAIGVVSDLLQLGLNPDNTIEVPPLSENSPAGWYRCSATSEELGPAVIPGHVNSAEHGLGVFLLPGRTPARRHHHRGPCRRHGRRLRRGPGRQPPRRPVPPSTGTATRISQRCAWSPAAAPSITPPAATWATRILAGFPEELSRGGGHL